MCSRGCSTASIRAWSSLNQAHQLAHDAEHALTHAVPRLSSALIHTYPANS